jgi:hypothetical protein
VRVRIRLTPVFKWREGMLVVRDCRVEVSAATRHFVEMTDDAVNDFGVGKNRDDHQFRATFRAEEWVHLEDFIDVVVEMLVKQLAKISLLGMSGPDLSAEALAEADKRRPARRRAVGWMGLSWKASRHKAQRYRHLHLPSHSERKTPSPKRTKKLTVSLPKGKVNLLVFVAEDSG